MPKQVWYSEAFSFASERKIDFACHNISGLKRSGITTLEKESQFKMQEVWRRKQYLLYRDESSLCLGRHLIMYFIYGEKKIPCSKILFLYIFFLALKMVNKFAAHLKCLPFIFLFFVRWDIEQSDDMANGCITILSDTK